MEAPLILLVDDDHRLRELTARYLESQGFRMAPWRISPACAASWKSAMST